LKSADFKVVSAPASINPAIKIKSTFIFPEPQPVILEKGMILDYDKVNRIMSSMKYNSIESQETLCASLPAKVLDLKGLWPVSQPFII
jgi:hypothetical protein